ncbi:MAG: DUF697 domain-containing protein [Synechococcaceae cyanobacterium SM2_3_2]|nr:DUF697 domain-containing protein [Synechococcaceae cyanobacterium SM2_3_2]
MPMPSPLTDDLNYHKAKQSLRQLVASFDLSALERAGLEADLEDLDQFIHKLESEVIHIAAFGMVGRGKSSLLNALLGYAAFTTGPTHGVTRSQQRAWWHGIPGVSARSLPSESPADIPNGSQMVSLSHWSGARMELIDTPGLDEVNGSERAQLAERVAQQADLILFVVSGDMTRLEYDALAQLREANKPLLLVFNKIDQYPELDRLEVYDKIRNVRVRQLLSPDEVVMAAASPRVAQAIQHPDGTISAQLTVGSPDVEALRHRILAVLRREGRSLIALNTLLFADRVQQDWLDRKLASREQQAQDLIWQAAQAKALAVALNPFTVVDALSGLAIDVTMIMRLAQLYGLPLTPHKASQLLQKIMVSMLSLGAGEWVAVLGLGSLKSFLGLAAPVSGGLSLGAYASVAITQATLAGVSSYAIGTAARTYLAQGSTWGPRGPKAAIAQILDHLDEGSITARIRSDLQKHTQPSPQGSLDPKNYKNYKNY